MGLRLGGALAIVYVVWGSTYLAIRYAIEGFPPLLSAALRFLTAALLLGGWVLARRGVPRMSRAEAGTAALRGGVAA